MEKKLSFFKRLSLYSDYKRIIKRNATELEQRFGLRRDRANRLYTVLNIPSDNIGEAYNLKKSDIDKISEGYIKDFSVEVAKYLDSKELKELYDFYELKKVDKYSYLVVYGFRLIDTTVYTRNLYYRVIPIALGLLVALALILFI